jgi:hypothetical protein
MTERAPAFLQATEFGGNQTLGGARSREDRPVPRKTSDGDWSSIECAQTIFPQKLSRCYLATLMSSLWSVAESMTLPTSASAGPVTEVDLYGLAHSKVSIVRHIGRLVFRNSFSLLQ